MDFSSKNGSYSGDRTRQMVFIGMLCAIAYISIFIFNGKIPLVPAVSFLTYDPKDIVIIFGGFIYGPFTCFVISFVVAFFEMITISKDGIVGFIMNVIAASAFTCTAAFIYKINKKYNKIFGAVAGLFLGCLAMTGIMAAWNYIITPVYLNMPREAVVEMLPAITLFNILKSGINFAVIMILYAPLMKMVKSLKISEAVENVKKVRINIGVIQTLLLLVITVILVILALLKKI